MNILTIIGLILLAICFITFMVGLFGANRAPNSAVPRPVVVLLLAMISMVAGGVLIVCGHAQSRVQKHAREAVFTKASESVFVNIKGAEEGYPALSSTSYGSITLADSSTVLITVKDQVPSPRGGVSSVSHGFKKSSIVAVNLPDSTYTLQGSLASDAKGWCFEIKNGNLDAFYNQNGFVDDNINGDITYVLCSHGLAYDYAGHAIVGSTNPVKLF